MSTSHKILLNDIIDDINHIDEDISGEGFRDFVTNRKAIIQIVNKLIEIQGKVQNLPSDFDFSNSIWNEIFEIDKSVVNADSEVDGEAVWKCIKKTLPNFRKELISQLKTKFN